MRFVALLAALVLASCATASPRQAAAHDAGAPIEAGRTFHIRSQILGDEREINVWLPPSYGSPEAAAETYTVLYVLDGGLDQDFPHIAGLGQLGALSWTYQQLIVVGVRSNARRHELTPAITREPRLARELPEAGGADEMRVFLEREVIPWVEARYRVGPRRALMGESLAGLFVVDTFLTQPALFHDYIAISPSLWWDNRAQPLAAAGLLANRAPSDTRLYLTIADEGGAMQSGMDVLLAALRGAPQGAVTWRFVDRSASETHATIYHGAALDALRWLYALPEPDYGPTPWYFLNEADRPPEP